MIFKVFSVQSDGSKILLQVFVDLISAQNSMNDSSIIYSIEQFNPLDNLTTIIL